MSGSEQSPQSSHLNIGTFAIFAVVGAISSAPQDIAVDAWRIDVADERTPVELLSAVYQFGYRTASIVGGAIALVLAARMPWGTVYLIMAALVVLLMVVAVTAPDTRPVSGALNKYWTRRPARRWSGRARRRSALIRSGTA